MEQPASCISIPIKYDLLPAKPDSFVRWALDASALTFTDQLMFELGDARKDM